MKRRPALEPVAFSLIKETLQPSSLVAELLNVMKDKRNNIIGLPWPRLNVCSNTLSMQIFNKLTRLACANRAQKIMQK